jgi:hypothetical protein
LSNQLAKLKAFVTEMLFCPIKVLIVVLFDTPFVKRVSLVRPQVSNNKRKPGLVVRPMKAFPFLNIFLFYTNTEVPKCLKTHYK